MISDLLFCIPKILKNESNSQPLGRSSWKFRSCFVSQRYWKMKAIHNKHNRHDTTAKVVLYPKDTEKWKQFTTIGTGYNKNLELFCIPKILKNESNSQHSSNDHNITSCCFVSQRYWKMKAIHNLFFQFLYFNIVVLYPKDTEKWKQFTTLHFVQKRWIMLFCIPKILKNESNSQLANANTDIP